MKRRVNDFSVDVDANTITLNEYVSNGFPLNRILTIAHCGSGENNRYVYLPGDTSLGGTIEDGVLTLDFDLSEAGYGETAEEYQVLIDDPDEYLPTKPLDKEDDSVENRPVPTKAVPIVGSGIVSAVRAQLIGVFVSSMTGGTPTIKLYDNASSGSGTVLIEEWAPPTVGFHPLGDIGENISNGVYCVVGGTGSIKATFCIRPLDSIPEV